MSRIADGQGPVERGFGSHLPVVFACCMLCGVSSAMLVSSAGIFYLPIADELADGQTFQISAWMSLMLLAGALSSPLMGRWTQRSDIRMVLVICIIGEAGVLALLVVGQAVMTLYGWRASYLVYASPSSWCFPRCCCR